MGRQRSGGEPIGGRPSAPGDTSGTRRVHRMPMSTTDPGTADTHDAYLQAVFDTVRDPLLILDDRLRVEASNQAFGRTFGLRAPAVLGTSIFELGDGDWDIPVLRARLNEILERAVTFEDLEVEHEFRGIGPRILHLNARRLQRSGDQRTRILLSLHDVTVPVQARRALRRQAQALARSNEELEQFAYVASHDLQEPLRMVSSYVQLLARRYEGQLDEDADKFIAYAVDGARRMKSLLSDLLTYSRVGRVGDDFEEVDLERVVDDVLEDLHLRAEELGARIERRGLPRVYGSPSQLRQLFENLVRNALDHHGEPPPRVRIEAEEDDAGAWTVTVRDEGPGIASEHHERVFEIFRRLAPRDDASGSGIGLAICRKIVRAHDGRIWVESEPGRGAAFRFTLPRTADAAATTFIEGVYP